MIELKNVSKKLGNDLVLDDVSLKLYPGKITGFIGKNGSGKSVLLKVICGFITPDSGNVLFNDVDIFKSKIFAPNTSALIERPKFIDHLSCFENLMLLADINKTIGKKEIEEALKSVNLDKERNKPFAQLSLGMKQKLGIAQVLMEDPDVMILDEPFNGLEEESIDDIRKILLAKRKENKIILIATHLKEDIESLCDEVIKLNLGKIVDKS